MLFTSWKTNPMKIKCHNSNYITTFINVTILNYKKIIIYYYSLYL